MALVLFVSLAGFPLEAEAAHAASVQRITLSRTSLTLTVGQTRTVKATVRPKSRANDVRWSSSNTRVATVNKTTGRITAKRAGTARITASVGGQRARLNLTVNKRQNAYLTQTINGVKFEIKRRTKQKNAVDITIENLTVTRKGNNYAVMIEGSGPIAFRRRLQIQSFDKDGNRLRNDGVSLYRGVSASRIDIVHNPIVPRNATRVLLELEVFGIS